MKTRAFTYSGATGKVVLIGGVPYVQTTGRGLYPAMLDEDFIKFIKDLTDELLPPSKGDVT